jgi:chloride channel 3/4/5
VVDVAVATVSDWKDGYCTANPFSNRENCSDWHVWSKSYGRSFSIYVGLALMFGTISSSATMLTRSELPSVEHVSAPQIKVNGLSTDDEDELTATSGGKVMYMAAGSGIPEIKTILSGFNIPSFLSLRVLVVKAFGAIFAVSTGMCLGKEGPFVHISTCVGYLVGSLFPKYASNGRKMRELLSAACSAGLSVAFGAPIGGVLFSYEEISTYFPRKVLWKAFLCSLVAAMVLKELNPTGTGKLVLFETKYGTQYEAVHYLVFVLLGAAGGVFGGVFCRLNGGSGFAALESSSGIPCWKSASWCSLLHCCSFRTR